MRISVQAEAPADKDYSGLISKYTRALTFDNPPPQSLQAAPADKDSLADISKIRQFRSVDNTFYENTFYGNKFYGNTFYTGSLLTKDSLADISKIRQVRSLLLRLVHFIYIYI